MDRGLIPIVVPGASPVELAEALEQLQLVGSTIDGADLGVEAVAVARVLGADGEVLVFGADEERPAATTESAVLEHLVTRWPDTLIGDEAADTHKLVWPMLVVRGYRTVAVTPRTDLMLGVWVRSAGVALHEARTDERLLVGMADEQELPVDVLVDVLVNAKGRSVVLWRTDTHVGLHVMRRGKHAEAHMWEPVWTPFGHPALDELRDPGLVGDAAAIGRLLELSAAEIVVLRAMMRRPRPDLGELSAMFGLPAAVLDVLEGRTAVAQLPGGAIVEPKGWISTLTESSEHDPRWIRWVERGSRELRPWYVVSSLITVVLGAVLAASWVAGGSAFGGVLGSAMVLGTTIDLPVRWWRKRRRSS